MPDIPPDLEDWTELSEFSPEDADYKGGEEEELMVRAWEIDEYCLVAEYEDPDNRVYVTLESEEGKTTTNERALPAPDEVTETTLKRITQDMVHKGVGSWGEETPALGP